MKKITSWILPLIIAGAAAVTLTGLPGCKKANYNELSDEDLAWIIYRNGDSIRFVSNAGQLMTFYAYGNTRYYVEDGKNYFEGSSIQFQLAKSPDPDDGNLIIQRVAGGLSAGLSWPHYNGTVDLINKPQVTDTLFGTVFTDLYVDSVLVTDQLLFIRKMYYSKSLGMIRFIDRYGYTWKNLAF